MDPATIICQGVRLLSTYSKTIAPLAESVSVFTDIVVNTVVR